MSAWTCLDPSDPGWDRVWAAIAARYGDSACLDRESNEVWQYMGTVIDGESGRHEFRHRNLPSHGRTYWTCPTKPGDFLPREQETTR